MALTGYLAKSTENFVGGSVGMPALASRYLALFTTAPGDNDSGAVEVSGGSYARVQIGGTIAAAASWTTSNNAITMGVSNPGWVVAGMQVYDTTASQPIGTVSSYTSTTLTLTANASHASSGSTDNLTFSAFAAATSQGPSTATTGAAITFAQSTGSWGTVVAWGIYDASTSGNLLWWDWLGNDPWYPCSITLASPGVITAQGITAGSSPNLANGASVVFTARFGGTLASGLSSETASTVAGLSSDAFNVGTNTSSTGSAMVRQITSQSIPSNITASFSSSSMILSLA